MPEPDPSAAHGRPRFSFVVVADTHVNEAENTSTSPYATNHLANPRARHAFAEIAAMRPPPRFVVHLGDIVHPVPSLPVFHDAVARFKAIASQLPVPLHVIPGNHDVGDKTVDWMPADQVCDAYLATYREAFGADWYAFDESGVRFVMLNSLLLNSGLADEAGNYDNVDEGHGCGRGSDCIGCVERGPGARRTFKYACAPGLAFALPIQPSPRPRFATR